MNKYNERFVSFQIVINVCSIKMKAFSDFDSFPSALVTICYRMLYELSFNLPITVDVVTNTDSKEAIIFL